MLELYHNDMSSCSQKVRLCLAEKGLEWKGHHLSLRAGDQQQDWYVKLNPRAVVPTLVDGDKVLPESNVIIEYLDEAYPNSPLRPEDSYERARMRLWTKQLDEGIHDAVSAVLSFAVAFRHQYSAAGEQGKQLLDKIRDPAKRQRRREVMDRGLDSQPVWLAVFAMDRLLSDMEEALSGQQQWLVSNQYTLADLALTPYVNRLDHLNLLGFLTGRPRVMAWYRRCQKRPSYQEAIMRWENKDYLALMEKGGKEHWPKIKSIIESLEHRANPSPQAA